MKTCELPFLHGRSETVWQESKRGEVNSFLGLVQECSNDIGMEFGMDKCAVLGIKNGKQMECKGVVLHSRDVMKDVDEDGYNYLGVIQNKVHI